MSIIDYLENNHIDFKSSGKNIGKGWIGLDCPFCGDDRFHFGIFKKSGRFSCWQCEERGQFAKYIMKIEGCSYGKAKDIAKKYIDEFFFDDEEEHKPYEGNILPKEASKKFPTLHIDYLKSRGFDPSSLIKKYKLQACYNLGNYRFRIIAPVFLNRRVVNFVAADVTGKGEPKYKYPPNKKVITPIHDCLYNIDNISGYAIIVEGITDVWNFGKGSVATLYKHLSQNQINLLLEKEVVKVIVIPDYDAQRTGENIANQLSGIIDQVDLIYLDQGDPGDLSLSEVKKLRRQLEIEL